MVMDKTTCILVTDILGSALGDVQPAMDAIANLATEELVPGGTDGQVMPPVEAYLHFKQRLFVF